MIFLYFAVLAGTLILLFKCADYFIQGSVGLADIYSIPKLIVGIVFVSLATTAPEFAVSVQAALLGHPEISLGNAVGSVIVVMESLWLWPALWLPLLSLSTAGS